MILLCYDIESNALRGKLSHKILEFGLDRINRSVYLGDLKDSDLKKLETWLRQQMAGAGQRDSLIILPVTKHKTWQMIVLGQNELDLPTITGDRDTLIF